MRVFKYIFFALLLMVLAFFAYGFFVLEDKVQVKRSIDIDRPAKMVFKVVNSMHKFNQWSPWAAVDPNATYQLSGPESGVGSKMAWQGNQEVGTGSQEIIESQLNQSIKAELYFDGQGDDPAWSSVVIHDKGDSVSVDWVFDADFNGDVLGRFFGMMMDDMLGPQYEKGLGNLKALVEAQTVYDFSGFSIEDVAAQTILYVSSEGSMSQDLSPVIGAAYGQVMAFMAEQSIEQAGSPLTINRSWGDGKWVFDAGIPVMVDGIESTEDNPVKLGSTYAGKAVKYIQVGPYDQAAASYELMDAYLADQGLEKGGDSWEVYANDPGTVTEAEYLTHIYQPIK